jgi:hypothetical protein
LSRDQRLKNQDRKGVLVFGDTPEGFMVGLSNNGAVKAGDHLLIMGMCKGRSQLANAVETANMMGFDIKRARGIEHGNDDKD